MSTFVFIAHVSSDAADGYRAQFPDLPDCKAHAPNLAELLPSARRAVIAALQALSDAGEAWPTPSPIEQVAASGGASILVDVTVDDPPVRVNISLGEKLLERLDAAAEARNMTRSGFIAQAVRVNLGERAGPNADFDALGQRLQDELTALGRRVNESLGPDSRFTQRMNEIDDFVFDGVRRAADGVSAAMTRRRSGVDQKAQQTTAESNGSGT